MEVSKVLSCQVNVKSHRYNLLQWCVATQEFKKSVVIVMDKMYIKEI